MKDHPHLLKTGRILDALIETAHEMKVEFKHNYPHLTNNHDNVLVDALNSEDSL